MFPISVQTLPIAGAVVSWWQPVVTIVLAWCTTKFERYLHERKTSYEGVYKQRAQVLSKLNLLLIEVERALRSSLDFQPGTEEIQKRLKIAAEKSNELSDYLDGGRLWMSVQSTPILEDVQKRIKKCFYAANDARSNSGKSLDARSEATSELEQITSARKMLEIEFQRMLGIFT